MNTDEEPRSVQRAATSQDVSRAAGVSQAAVSRVFTPGASVSKAMRDKVTAAADRLGYHPNALARGLAGGRSHLIAVVISDVGRSFFGQILDRLIISLQLRKLKALVVTVPPTQEPLGTLREILAYGVDGVVIASVTLPSSAVLAEGARREGLPVVLINQDTPDPRASAVLCDDRRGADMAAGLLVAAGCRRLAYLSGPPETYTSRTRLVGFGDALQERDLCEPMLLAGDYTYESGRAAAQALLFLRRKPDGVFCANDLMALGLIDRLRDSSLTIGRDLCVVGFDGIEAGGWAGYELATIEQPLSEMSDRAAILLHEQITNPAQRGQTVLVAPRARVRGSCQAVGSGERVPVPVTR